MALELGRAQRSDVLMRLGLFTVPLRVFTSVAEDKQAQLHTVCDHGHDPMRAKQVMYCPACVGSTATDTMLAITGQSEHGPEAREAMVRALMANVPALLAVPDTFSRGKQVGDQLVVVDEATLAKANDIDLKYKDEMELTVHPAEQVTAALVPSGKNYWLGVNPRGTDAYVAMAQLVEARPDLAFMCRWTIKTVAATYRLRVAGDATLVLEQMADPALVRKMPEVTGHVNPRQMVLVEQLADMLITDFEPATGRGKSEVLADFFKEHAGDFETEAAAGNAVGLAGLQQALAAAMEAAGPRPVPKSKRGRHAADESEAA